MTEKKRTPKVAAPRTEVFAMRLDPKLKYLAEIAARKQRRSLANFIEWAIERTIAGVKLADSAGGIGDFDFTVGSEANKLWGLEPADRLINLAQNYPDLLTYEEQVIWKAILEIKVSETYEDDKGKAQLISYDFVDGVGDNKTADRVIVRECWSTLVAFAGGNATVKDVQAALKEAIPF